ncbi:MAG: GntR family transcriptional regulator [Solirubrobacterales bacterium]
MAAEESAGRTSKPLGVQNKTLREQVFDHLREEILSSRLKPGQELNELALSAELEVSRGPIREALSRLASEGLVKVTPRRGAVVSELTDEEFVEAYQVREALETLAIRLAVPRIEPDELDLLRDLHQQMNDFVANDEVKAFFDANSAFHQQIVDASGNAKLGEHYRLLMAQMGRYLPRSLTLRGTIDSSPEEHKAILGAIEAGDPEEAARLLGNHIEIPQRIEAGEEEPSRPVLTAAEESEEQ